MSAREYPLIISDAFVYREVQRFLGPIVLLGVGLADAGVAAVVAAATATSRSGSPPVGAVVAIALAIVVPALLLGSRLVTEVSAVGLRVRLTPLQPHGRRESWTRVVSYGVVTYRPVRDYGGWGIREQ